LRPGKRFLTAAQRPVFGRFSWFLFEFNGFRVRLLGNRWMIQWDIMG
jgi:hypothetical protein